MAETEAMLASCPDTFIFYQRGTNDVFIVHMPLRVRMRNYIDIFTDWEERKLRAFAESLWIHIRFSPE